MTTNITLAKRLANTKNYLYEATMGDYSMDSILRGERNLREVEAEVFAAGLNPKTLVVWTEQGWKPVENEGNA